MILKLNNTISGQKGTHTPHSKKKQKPQDLQCDQTLILRTEETFRFAIKATENSQGSPTFRKIHEQTKALRSSLVGEKIPPDLVTKLSLLQKITDPNNSRSGIDSPDRILLLGVKINNLAKAGLEQANAYK